MDYSLINQLILYAYYLYLLLIFRLFTVIFFL